MNMEILMIGFQADNLIGLPWLERAPVAIVDAEETSEDETAQEGLVGGCAMDAGNS